MTEFANPHDDQSFQERRRDSLLAVVVMAQKLLLSLHFEGYYKEEQ
jgi:hypothetical protein